MLGWACTCWEQVGFQGVELACVFFFLYVCWEYAGACKVHLKRAGWSWPWAWILDSTNLRDNDNGVKNGLVLNTDPNNGEQAGMRVLDMGVHSLIGASALNKSGSPCWCGLVCLEQAGAWDGLRRALRTFIQFINAIFGAYLDHFHRLLHEMLGACFGRVRFVWGWACPCKAEVLCLPLCGAGTRSCNVGAIGGRQTVVRGVRGCCPAMLLLQLPRL